MPLDTSSSGSPDRVRESADHQLGWLASPAWIISLIVGSVPLDRTRTRP